MCAMADEAVAIGPAPSAESYLASTGSSRPARQTGAEAVHPGYGFLSEKPAFAAALEEAGIAFIGPPPDGDRRDGRQDRVEEAGARRRRLDRARPSRRHRRCRRRRCAIAREIGYPVMIKASAGGGGKGMRIAHDDARGARRLPRAPAARPSRASPTTASSSRNTSRSRATSRSRCWATRTATSSISASANARSSAATRRSSRRRRARFSTPQTRAAMGEQAVALARAVGYRSAGTVEFIVDRSATSISSR